MPQQDGAALQQLGAGLQQAGAGAGLQQVGAGAGLQQGAGAAWHGAGAGAAWQQVVFTSQHLTVFTLTGLHLTGFGQQSFALADPTNANAATNAVNATIFRILCLLLGVPKTGLNNPCRTNRTRRLACLGCVGNVGGINDGRTMSRLCGLVKRPDTTVLLAETGQFGATATIGENRSLPSGSRPVDLKQDDGNPLKKSSPDARGMFCGRVLRPTTERREAISPQDSRGQPLTNGRSVRRLLNEDS